ncbi:MAG TPA: hypothetical protein VN798_15900, partial [Pseudomonas sp.]|nr:hypothetical protein [Pseudomonas sp.]
GQRFRYLAMALLAAMLLTELGGLRNDYRVEDGQFDTLVNQVNHEFIAGDRIVVSDLFWYFSYVYYNKTGSLPLLYTPQNGNGASGRPGNYGFGTLVANKADAVYLDSLEQLGPGPGRVWLISSSYPADDFPSIPSHWVQLNAITVGDTQARLYNLSTLGRPPSLSTLNQN